MTINYEQIKQEHIKKYGTDIDEYGPTLLENLYADRTHFIYELIQNAEDAKATSLSFTLYPDGLEFKHDGRSFDEADVKGICRLAKGTKATDLTQIGRFGIGFKSVFAHTSSPQIHSGSEHFEILHYVQPQEIEPIPIADHVTCFLLPFNKQSTNPQDSYKEIASRLKELGIRTLLFLHSIEFIAYKICDKVGHVVKEGNYLRNQNESHSLPNLRKQQVTLEDSENKPEYWTIYQREIASPFGNSDVPIPSGLMVEIALQQDEAFRKYIPLKTSNLYVFFVTEQRVDNCGFLIQGPYRTTPARDNVAQNDPFNKALVEYTSRFLIDIMRYLRDQNQLDVPFLEMLPLNSDQSDSLFAKLYQELKKEFQSGRYLPSYRSGYLLPSESILARGTGLKDLFSSKYLLMLYNKYDWVTDEITEDKTSSLYRTLRDSYQVRVIDPERLASDLKSNPSFLKRVDIEWLILLYEFFSKQQGYRLMEFLRQTEIVRLDTGEHVLPHPTLAYLADASETTLPCVHPKLIENKTSEDFLKSLDLIKPDLVDEVIKDIRDSYSTSRIIDAKESIKFTRKIRKFLEMYSKEDSEKQKRKLKEALLGYACISCENPSTKETALEKPGNLYLPTEENKIFFEGNPDIWFVSQSIYVDFSKILEELGCHKSPIIIKKSPDQYGHITYSGHGDHARGLNGFDPNFMIVGLKHAVQHPSIERSRIIWDILLKDTNMRMIEGKLETSTRKTYEHSSTHTRTSEAGYYLTNYPWLPNKSNGFDKPCDISLDDLPDEFQRNKDLARALGLKQTDTQEQNALQQLSEHLNMPLTALERLKKLSLSMEDGELERMINDLEKKVKNRNSYNQLEKSHRSSQEQQYYTDPDDDRDDEEEDFPIPDTSKRQKKIAEEIQNRQSDEPTHQERHPLRVTDRQRDIRYETKHTLYEYYRGKCQICDETFKKPDGKNFFETFLIIKPQYGEWVDHPGNALCLCSNHHARMTHTDFDAESILNFVRESKNKILIPMEIKLANEQVKIRFKQEHWGEIKAFSGRL